MGLFANLIADPNSCGRLQKFDFSGCRLNDTGLLYLIKGLEDNNRILSIKLTENFFSQNIEGIVLETLNKNVNLIEIGLTGNRFNHTCVQKVKQIT